MGVERQEEADLCELEEKLLDRPELEINAYPSPARRKRHAELLVEAQVFPARSGP